MRVIQRTLLTLILMVPALLMANERFLIDYFKEFNTMEANFTQIINTIESEERSSGKLYIMKRDFDGTGPKFFFDYQKPFPQQLISNGQKFWDYDEDLMQVVLRPVSVINDNPLLVVLLGEKRIEDYFDIKVRQNRRQYDLMPKDLADGLEVILLSVYFDGRGNLTGFNAVETTGQEIRFNFTNIRRDGAINPAYFNFSLPAGVDLIDDSKAR